jgi:ribosomal protein S18 acetylase RimI-like enzyme
MSADPSRHSHPINSSHPNHARQPDARVEPSGPACAARPSNPPVPDSVPGIDVRAMTAADLEPVRWIIFRAYTQVLIDLYGADAGRQYEVRSTRFMDLYRRRDPGGCLVAETAAGDLAGAVFCFAWGEVGWFGSLAVAPEYQGRRIGQALTGRAVAYLEARGCRRIGLETWPQQALVRHLYGKLGFVALRSTIKLSRPVTAAPVLDGWTCEWYTRSDDSALPAAIDAVQDVTRSLVRLPGEPCPAYDAEVRVPVLAGWADLGVLRSAGGAPAAFALCFTRKPSGAAAGALDVRLLCVAPGDADAGTLTTALAACDRRAAEMDLPSVTCDVNLRQARAAGLLHERGFRPIYELLRMERPLEGFDAAARSPALEYARWAG